MCDHGRPAFSDVGRNVGSQRVYGGSAQRTCITYQLTLRGVLLTYQLSDTYGVRDRWWRHRVIYLSPEDVWDEQTMSAASIDTLFDQPYVKSSRQNDYTWTLDPAGPCTLSDQKASERGRAIETPASMRRKVCTRTMDSECYTPVDLKQGEPTLHERFLLRRVRSCVAIYTICMYVCTLVPALYL